ncbi:thioesterase family protein [uncultured Sulfitobacter sp.]|uniref:acyl-CoA thioesterase n=1 Tax=uncultured Sulfitobacter sp. TaxID=191468 RepID=UPI0030DC7133|tara:strand:+ start:28615 stop:29094 length:480 start_codon:yes stop_codon:yes gene_type:complete
MKLVYHSPLSADQQRDAGLTEPQPLAMADQVRYSDLDTNNHVNNCTYFEWFERLRIRYTQTLLEQGLMDAPGPRVVIRSGSIRYLHELLEREDYIVTCRCTGFRNTSYSISQQIWVGGQLRATFDCVLVMLKKDGSGRYPLPDRLKRHFENHDKATAET